MQTIEADGLQTLENWWWILCGGKSDHEFRFRSNLSDFWGWWTLAFHKHAKQLDLYVRRIEAQDGFCVVASGSKEELLDLGSWGHGATNWNTSLCVSAVRFQQTVHVGIICCCLPVVFHKLCSDFCETKGAFSSWPDETTPFPVCWGRDCWHPCGTSAAGRSAICYLLCSWWCCDVFFLVCPACVWDIKGTFETLVWFAGLQFRLLLRDWLFLRPCRDSLQPRSEACLCIYLFKRFCLRRDKHRRCWVTNKQEHAMSFLQWAVSKSRVTGMCSLRKMMRSRECCIPRLFRNMAMGCYGL